MNILVILFAFINLIYNGQGSIINLKYPLKDQPPKCIGITTKGKPCQLGPISGKSFCFHHDPSRITCEGINSHGKRCLNNPVRDGKFCNTHDPGRLKCKGINERGKPCQESPIDDSGYCRFHTN